MSRQVDSNISRLIDGLGLEGEDNDFCDFTIADQNSIEEAHGITPTAPSTYKPVFGENVTYIVAFVVINDAQEVLLMEEATQSCAGKLYLPSGPMKKGETIVQATIREVLEKTGLLCVPKTLLLVETAREAAGGMWFRFILSGEIVGGELKTPVRADKESMQAKWISNYNERGHEISAEIGRAKLYKSRQGSAYHQEILPAPIPHAKNIIRLIVFIHKRNSNNHHVLLSQKSTPHFPTFELHPTKGFSYTLRWFMFEVFGADVGRYRRMNLLNVECDPAADGCCLTLMVKFDLPLDDVQLIGKYAWHELTQNINDVMYSNTSIQFLVIDTDSYDTVQKQKCELEALYKCTKII